MNALDLRMFCLTLCSLVFVFLGCGVIVAALALRRVAQGIADRKPGL